MAETMALAPNSLIVTDNREPLSPSPTLIPASPSLPMDQTKEVVKLKPAFPSDLSRYTAGDKYVYTRIFRVTPLQFSHPTSPWLSPACSGWDRYDHPEGAPYYHNRRLQLVTYSNIFDEVVLGRLEAAAAQIHALMKTHVPPERLQREMNESMDRGCVSLDESVWHYGIDEWELCLEVSSGTENECLYYVTSWSRRCVWWPEPLDTKELGAGGMACDEQLYWTLQGHFWNHVGFFPQHRSLPQGAVESLEAALMFFSHDLLTSKDSTMSYTREELTAIYELLQRIKANPFANGELSAVVGRQMSEMCDDRAYNLHGTSLARMSRYQSRHYEPHCQRPFVNSVFARGFTFLFLFNKPRSFDRKLCEAWIDRSAFYIQWKELVKDVQEEWKAAAFMGTVMLAANMGFLTIDGKPNLPNTAKTLSVISTTLSLGSIVSGMLLGHQHRSLDTSTTTAMDANRYFVACERRPLGLYGVAMLFSVPLAMQMWSFLLFVAGVLWYSFKLFDRAALPFIGAAVLVILAVIGVQGVYFHGLGPQEKGSTWRLEERGGHIMQAVYESRRAPRAIAKDSDSEDFTDSTANPTSQTLPSPITAPLAPRVAMPRRLLRRSLSSTAKSLVSPTSLSLPRLSGWPPFWGRDVHAGSSDSGGNESAARRFDDGSTELGMLPAASRTAMAPSTSASFSPEIEGGSPRAVPFTHTIPSLPGT